MERETTDGSRRSPESEMSERVADEPRARARSVECRVRDTLRLREGLVLSFAMLLNAECAVMRSIRAFADSDSASVIGARGRLMCLRLT